MNRIIGLFVLLVAFNASALEINSKLSGSWYNPAQDGHGLNVATLDENRTLVYWYVYHTDGTQMFLVTVGTNDGNQTTGTTYYNTGMKFGSFNPNDLEQTVWGTSTVTFHDCNSATLEYASDDPAYSSGTIPMQRLSSVSGLKCSDSPLHGTSSLAIVDFGNTLFGTGIGFENGDLVFGVANDESGQAGIGSWRVTGKDTFTFDVKGYSVTGGWGQAHGNGTFSEDRLIATYTGNNKMVGNPVPSFQHSLNTSKMAGNYDIYDSFNVVVGSAVVENDGKVNGSTVDGCVFDGAFSVPNTNFNQAYVDVNVTNCGNTVQLIGAAVYNNPQHAIVVIAADGWYGYVWTLKLK